MDELLNTFYHLDVKTFNNDFYSCIFVLTLLLLICIISNEQQHNIIKAPSFITHAWLKYAYKSSIAQWKK